MIIDDKIKMMLPPDGGAINRDYSPRALKPGKKMTEHQCYDNDCMAECWYREDEFYEYFDAALGNIIAFTCKKCGLTNMV